MFTFHFPQSRLRFKPDNCQQPCRIGLNTSARVFVRPSLVSIPPPHHRFESSRDSAKQIGILLTSSFQSSFHLLHSCICITVYLQSRSITLNNITQMLPATSSFDFRASSVEFTKCSVFGAIFPPSLRAPRH